MWVVLPNGQLLFHESRVCFEAPLTSSVVLCVCVSGEDSGVGAGIDSYYEYLLKAYVLLGDDLFLQRFNIVRGQLNTHTPLIHSYLFILHSGILVAGICVV